MSDATVETEEPLPEEAAPPDLIGSTVPPAQYPRRVATGYVDGVYVVTLEVDNEEDAAELANGGRARGAPYPAPMGWRVDVEEPQP